MPQISLFPKFFESGINIVGIVWYGVFVPAKTPEAIIDRLNKAPLAGLAEPEIRQKRQVFGLQPTGTKPQELAAIQRADLELWAPVVKASGFVAD